MLAARSLLVVSVAVSLLLVQNAAAQAVGSSASDASTVSGAMSGLIQQFAASQSQSQLGLASQAFGLNSGSNSHPFLNGSTSDSSALGSAMNRLSSVFDGASSGSSLLSNLSPMTIPQITLGGLIVNPDILDLSSAESAFDDYVSPYCSAPFFNASIDVPAVLAGPSLTVTLTTGTCEIVKNKDDKDGKSHDKSDLLDNTLTCIGPELSYEKTPAAFVSKYKSAATFSTKSCQLSVNTTDNFSKVLYSGGEDVTYSSVQDFMSALTDGSFALGMLPTQTFVPVREMPTMAPASAASAVSAAAAAPAAMPSYATSAIAA